MPNFPLGKQLEFALVAGASSLRLPNAADWLHAGKAVGVNLYRFRLLIALSIFSKANRFDYFLVKSSSLPRIHRGKAEGISPTPATIAENLAELPKKRVTFPRPAVSLIMNHDDSALLRFN